MGSMRNFKYLIGKEAMVTSFVWVLIYLFIIGAAEKARWLRALTFLSEDLSSLPTTHITVHTDKTSKQKQLPKTYLLKVKWEGRISGMKIGKDGLLWRKLKVNWLNSKRMPLWCSNGNCSRFLLCCCGEMFRLNTRWDGYNLFNHIHLFHNLLFKIVRADLNAGTWKWAINQRLNRNTAFWLFYYLLLMQSFYTAQTYLNGYSATHSYLSTPYQLAIKTRHHRYAYLAVWVRHKANHPLRWSSFSNVSTSKILITEIIQFFLFLFKIHFVVVGF